MKQTAKEKREAAFVKAVENRLADILCGAYGAFNQGDLDDAMSPNMCISVIGIEGMSRFIGGVRHAFGVSDEAGKDYPFNTVSLRNWDESLEKIAEWLAGFEFVRQAMKGRA